MSMKGSGEAASLIHLAGNEMRARFKIGYATFQIETPKLAESARCEPPTSFKGSIDPF